MDVTCSCDHQFSWPHANFNEFGEIQDYENFLYEFYLGNYCDWVYGSGPIEDVDFTQLNDRKIMMNRTSSTEKEIMVERSAKFAAENLAICNPAGCKADFVGDQDIRDWIQTRVYLFVIFCSPQVQKI